MKNIILLLFIMVALQSKDLKDVTLQLKWKYQFQFAGFLIAKEKGFYKEVGLNVNVKEFEPDINIIKDIQENKIEFGISDSSLVYEAMRDKPVTAMMAIFQESPFVLLGLKSSNLKSLHDIKWHKIALHNGLDGIAIKTMLKASNINYIEKEPIFKLDKIISGEIDLMTAYISNEPLMAKDKGIDIVTFAPKDYGFEGYGDILFTSHNMINNHPKTVYNMKQASIKGWKYAFANIDETVDLIYNKYNTFNKTKQALKYEALILKKISGIGQNFGELNIEKIKSIAQLFNLRKGDNYKLDKLYDFIYKKQNIFQKIEELSFSEKEKEFIKKKKNIKVCYVKKNHPFVIENNKGKFSGISIDYLQYISEKTGLTIKMIETKNIKEKKKFLKQKKCDLLPLVATNINQDLYITPSKSIGKDSLVLVTKINQQYIFDLKKLKNKKVAIRAGTKNIQKYIKKIYPNLEIVETKGFGLKKVLNEEVYGAIGISLRMNYLIMNNFSNDLKIMGIMGDEKISGSLGISHNNPILLSIINKVIENMTPQDKQNIFIPWYIVKVEKGIDPAFILKISLIVISLFLLVIIFLIILKRKVKQEVEKSRQKDQIIFQKARQAQMGEMISMIAHQWRQPLASINGIIIALQLNTITNKYNFNDKDDVDLCMKNQDEKFKKIISQVKQLSTTIDDFRDFFKPNKEKDFISIVNPINKALQIVKAELSNKEIKINLNFQTEEKILIHHNEILQVILNLIKNSEDNFIEKNIQNPKINITTEKLNDEDFIICFCDNGGGISSKIIDKVFDPYFSTKSQEYGTGIGLYMSKMIIEEYNNGKLTVSNDKEGAKFKIFLKNK